MAWRGGALPPAKSWRCPGRRVTDLLGFQPCLFSWAPSLFNPPLPARLDQGRPPSRRSLSLLKTRHQRFSAARWAACVLKAAAMGDEDLLTIYPNEATLSPSEAELLVPAGRDDNYPTVVDLAI